MKIPLPPRLRGWIDGNTWLNETTKRKNFVLPYILIAAIVLSGLALLGAQRSQDDLQQDKRTELIEYIVAANTYNQCVTRSVTRDDLRSAINDLFSFLASLAHRFNALDIEAAVTAGQVEFNAKYTPVPIETCPLPPDPPDGVVPIPINAPSSLVTVPSTAAS